MIISGFNISMIVSDLDDTLLRNDKCISERTRNILALCRESGIKVVYATGRGRSAERVAPSQIFDGRISMNGAVAIVNNALVYSRKIPYQIARPILMACDQYGLKVASELSDINYTNFIVSDVWPNAKDFEVVDFSQHNIDAEKLYMLVNNPDDAAFIRKHLPENLYLCLSKDGLAQVMHKEATKAKAIAKLAKIWNIEQSQIVAFGDDLNDIDMLEYAGIGIAMENALDEVKAAADFVCASNDEDGVAEWIFENVFEGRV